MNDELDFGKHQKEVKEKMVQTNGLLSYMNGVGRGMEINTTIILYKSLIRSIFDYGSMIYYPNKERRTGKVKASEELENIQFRGLRTAMGYRMSTRKKCYFGISEDIKHEGNSYYASKRIIGINYDLGKRRP